MNIPLIFVVIVALGTVWVFVPDFKEMLKKRKHIENGKIEQK